MANKLGKEHQVYMSGKQGPFRCDNCEYYVDPKRCREEHIIELAKKEQFGLYVNGSYAVVDPAGCSDYFKKK